MIHYFKFTALLQKETWLKPAYVGVNNVGVITYLSKNSPPHIQSIDSVDGYILPGFQNTHSHVFQYAMAGLTETQKKKEHNDFWSWRSVMYKCALSIDPNQIEAIAKMLYTEMICHGYTNVAEFHYLHHDKKGNPYNNLAEMGERIVAGAKQAGIKITLIPLFEPTRDFGHVPQLKQRRFISKTQNDYLKLLDASHKAIKFYSNANIGFGIHSLRTVDLATIITTYRDAPHTFPFHIHIAEQKKEVENCLAYSGKRPIQWVFDNLPVTNKFHFVHATHLDDRELFSLSQSKAHVIICPSTESNLGDGLFRMTEYVQQGGRWSIGTDSHVGINLLEELRMIDYCQRLLTHRRNPFERSSASYMINESTHSGRQAMGSSSSENFELGKPLDAVVFDAQTPLLSATSLKNVTSTIVFSSDVRHIYGTLINGKWMYKNNSMKKEIKQSFIRAVTNIRTA